ncbi:MAG: hypothetical protein ACLTK0_08700 [Anaerovoracaceae bacterium]
MVLSSIACPECLSLYLADSPIMIILLFTFALNIFMVDGESSTVEISKITAEGQIGGVHGLSWCFF